MIESSDLMDFDKFMEIMKPAFSKSKIEWFCYEGVWMKKEELLTKLKKEEK